MSREKHHGRVILLSVSLTCLLAGGLAGGLGVHYWWLNRLENQDFQAARPAPAGLAETRAEPAAPVRVSAASLESVRPEKRIVGRLREIRKVTVASEVTGKIVAMNVVEGTPVTTDKTIIASIDNTWLDLGIDRQKALVEVITTRLAKEKANLDRVRALHRRDVATDREYEDQRAAYDETQAELKAARVALADLREKRNRVDIRAPFDGWVVARRAELGQHLSPGSPVVDIISRGHIYAEMNVPESLVNGLEAGMDIPVTVEPIERTYTGKIESINPYGATASRTYPVRVILSDDGGRLKAGMSTEAVFPAGETGKQIVVSRDAVLIKPDGNTVWVVRDGSGLEAFPVPVTVVSRVGDRYAVRPLTDGGQQLLVDGATVVVEGAERLRPRQEVAPLDRGPGKPERPDGPAASS